MKKRLSQFLIVLLCLVTTLLFSNIKPSAAMSVENNGVNYETFTISNITTTIGNYNGMGGNNGRPPGGPRR